MMDQKTVLVHTSKEAPSCYFPRKHIIHITVTNLASQRRLDQPTTMTRLIVDAPKDAV
jgi:hypothetical protein